MPGSYRVLRAGEAWQGHARALHQAEGGVPGLLLHYPGQQEASDLDWQRRRGSLLGSAASSRAGEAWRGLSLTGVADRRRELSPPSVPDWTAAVQQAMSTVQYGSVQ